MSAQFPLAPKIDFTVERIDVTSDPKVSARHLSLIDRARNLHVAETRFCSV